MNQTTGLTSEEWHDIRSVFFKYPDIERVILYGSRAMGNYQPASDIDLTLIGEDIDLGILSDITFELDDLLLPYKFDLSIYQDISNEALKEHIKRVGIVLYEKVPVN
ncbi:nucleotidyltransferase domain-containing protein [Cyclonatronum proteinivorum]|uniref:nucleotidyltransferase domain-containing protein n=1 Tax=Cyclonatronum proteinivorum TaxID=1457365 RepID=UPI000E0E0B36|nr:nucleotidyltransferase domain-containing protein [Cyclonatronum proteinivorum]